MTSNKSKVQEKKNGQVVVTIPRGIADAHELVGSTVEWKTLSANALRVEKVSDGGDE